jgi:poly(3-hydroxybutyrate) depolymerase
LSSTPSPRFPLRSSSTLAVGLAIAVALAVLAPVLAFAQSQPAVGGSKLRAEHRLPWSRTDDWAIRTWLVAGPFEATLAEDALSGEAGVKPKADQEQPRKTGGSVKWKSFTAWSDTIDLDGGIGGLSPDAKGVAYAFATVTRAQAGRALLSLGSDDGIRVWVNGALVHEHTGRRPLVFDEDRVETEMKAGENSILVKVEQRRGPWSFSLRVLEPGSVLKPEVEIGPFVFDEGVQAGTLKVRTDVPTPRAGGAPVSVDVVAAGGTIVATRKAARGETLTFDAAPWADGAYEVRFSTAALSGRTWATHLPWFKGDPRTAARRVVEAAKTADVATPAGMIRRMLGELVLDRVGGDLDKAGVLALDRTNSAVMEAAELDLEAAGKTGRRRGYGFVRLAWRDDTDGSVQFCRVYLPPGYRPDRRWPVVVNLHGYNPANPVYVRWWSVDNRHHAVQAEDRGADAPIFIEPHGRGNTQYLGFGDADVLRAIAEAKRLLSVDEDRVALTGDSMGGWGTWNVGSRHPQLFSAIAPVFGGADYHSQLPETALEKLNAEEKRLWDRRTTLVQLESLSNLPIQVLHGDADKSVNVDFSRYNVRVLQRWGYDVRYRELPGRGHEDMKTQLATVDWLVKQRRVADPPHVRLRSAEPRYAEAYWVRLARPEDPLGFLEADAELIGRNRIRVDTRNALSVTLTPARLVDAEEPVEVIWNGAARSVPVKDGRLELRDEKDRPAPLEKNAAVAGPFRDVTNTPFAIVLGTISSDPAMRKMCALKAEAAVMSWRGWQNQPPRLFEDTKLTDVEAARYSLLLIGGPADNALAQRLASRIPLEVRKDAVLIDGKAFEVSDGLVAMVYPNPLNAERYVGIVAGTSAGGLWFWEPGDRMAGAGDWDFRVEDGRTGPAAASVQQDFPFSERGRLVSGVFDRDWRIDERGLVRGDAELRAKATPVEPPKLVEVNPAVFDRLVGRYDLGAVKVAVRREGDRLIGEQEGQPPVELLPESETSYVLAVQNLRLSFELDAGGRATTMVVKLPGQEIKGKRVE